MYILQITKKPAKSINKTQELLRNTAGSPENHPQEKYGKCQRNITKHLKKPKKDPGNTLEAPPETPKIHYRITI